ncbi:MOSC domain-containing protein [Paenibacillus albus]|uniref:MOSC domain-containing protein n=1 Tax=Paenibacillus albus TaxID=2495582 RepID=UPI0013DFDE59|nr:MOSC domain-containing protein [Paenibacillus albus]
MSVTTIGTITTIRRYPVKSMAGEVLQSSRIDSYGLYGDRSYAFIDETKEGWDRYFTARNASQLLSYRASLGENAGTSVESTGVAAESTATAEGSVGIVEGSVGIVEGSAGKAEERAATVDRFPPVAITAPDGRKLQWNEELLQEIQQFAKPELSLLEHRPSSPELLAVDASSILIVTDKSVRKLEAMWGKPLDPLRFRANLLVTLEDEDGDEGSWLGKRLIVGTAELQIDEYCERCSMITIDPETFDRDPSLLRKVNEELNLHFGVYASVVKPGHVRVGDGVYWA